MKWITGWSVAWIKDKQGEIYRGSYKFAAGRLVLCSSSGKRFEGYRDGKTSWDGIEWFPDCESTELFEWRNPGAPKITSNVSVCKKCGE
jgi:hypothetical protein